MLPAQLAHCSREHAYRHSALHADHAARSAATGGASQCSEHCFSLARSLLPTQVPVNVTNVDAFPAYSNSERPNDDFQYDSWWQLVDNVTADTPYNTVYGARTSANSSTPSFTFHLNGAQDNIVGERATLPFLQQLAAGCFLPGGER